MTLRDLLTQHVTMLAGIGNPALVERFVLRNGTEFADSAFVPAAMRGEGGACFMNAYRRWRELGGAYVEGFGFTPGLIPIHHAWVGQGTKAIEVTWAPTLVSGKPRQNTEYLGVVFTPEEVRATAARTGVYGVLSDGFKINTDLIFQRDPELREIAKEVVAARYPATVAM